MILTKIDKEIFADEVLKIMQIAREEIDDAGSEHRRTCAKLRAYEDIERLLKALKEFVET